MAITWDSEYLSNLTLSGGDLTASHDSGTQYGFGVTRSTISRSSGKWYFEIVLNSWTKDTGYHPFHFGVGSDSVYYNAYLGSTAQGWGVRSNGEYGTTAIHPSDNVQVSATAMDVGDVVQVAFDADNNYLWFGLNGTWANSGNPATGTNPTYTGLISGDVYAYVSMWDTASATARFKDDDFSYSVPGGFLPFDITPEAQISTTMEGASSSITSSIEVTSTISSILNGAISSIVFFYASVVGGIATIPAWMANGTIHQNSVSGATTLERWTVSGYTGVAGKVSWASWTGDGAFSNPGFVSGITALPRWSASGSIKQGALASAVVTLPVWTARGYTGAVANITLPVWTVSGLADNPGVVRGVEILPAWRGVGTVLGGAIVSGSVDLLPWSATGTLLTGSCVTGAVMLPAWTAFGTLDSPITETTYAINLSTGAVTQLLLGAFDKLVTAHGRLYGLKNGNLVVLEGEDDQGTAIAATIRLAPQQFGTYATKRIEGAVYLNAREINGVTLTLVQDESTLWTYQTSVEAGSAMRTHKVKVGRGICFHSLGIILQNREGGQLDIGGLELLVNPLGRRTK